MFVKHPTENILVNIEKYADVRCCPKNPTHIDFYLKPQKAGKRGKPDMTFVFASEEERSNWFSQLTTRQAAGV